MHRAITVTSTALAALTFVVLTLIAGTASAADWSLDPTFAEEGVLRVTGLRDSTFTAVTPHDGAIVAAGTTIAGRDSEVFVAVSSSGGILDADFSGDGVVVRAGLGGAARGAQLAVDSGGVITAVAAFERRVAVYQWTPTGARNTTFAGDGLKELRVRTALGYNAPQVAVDRRGRVVVAAMTGNGTSSDVVVYRLRPNGSLDANFSGDGVRTINDGKVDWIDALATDGQNRVLVGTDIYSPSSSREPAALVHRLTDAGRDDASFSGDGLITLRLAPRAGSLALDIEPASGGVSVALGRWGSHYGVVRLTYAGRFDRSYGDLGMLSVNCQCTMIAADLWNGQAAFSGLRPSLTQTVVARLSGAGTSVVVGEYDVVPGSAADYGQGVLVQGAKTVVVGHAYSDDPFMARLQ